MRKCSKVDGLAGGFCPWCCSGWLSLEGPKGMFNPKNLPLRVPFKLPSLLWCQFHSSTAHVQSATCPILLWWVGSQDSSCKTVAYSQSQARPCSLTQLQVFTCGRLKNGPQRCSCPNPGNCEYVTLYDNKDFADVTILRILRWRDDPELSRRAQRNYKGSL